MKRIKSFTLIELITAIGLGALILSGLGAIFAGTIRLWSSIQNSTSALKEGMVSMQWITRDIMEKEIVNAGDSYIEFIDGTEYHLEEKTLKRGEDLVADGITQMSLTYNDPEDIKFVSILIKVKADSNELEFRNGVCVRNYESS